MTYFKERTILERKLCIKKKNLIFRKKPYLGHILQRAECHKEALDQKEALDWKEVLDQGGKGKKYRTFDRNQV